MFAAGVDGPLTSSPSIRNKPAAGTPDGCAAASARGTVGPRFIFLRAQRPGLAVCCHWILAGASEACLGRANAISGLFGAAFYSPLPPGLQREVLYM